MEAPRIGVIICAWKRDPSGIVAAVRSQTIEPRHVVVWQNESTAAARRDWILCGDNWGVWPRLFVGLLLDVEYIALFDDDSVPGDCWFENCLDTLKKIGPSLLGSCGVAFPTGQRQPAIGIGWKHPTTHIVMADIVGHAWFFPKGLLAGLSAFASENSLPFDHGEDYLLAYLAKKAGWHVACPPHPTDNKRLWGSLRGHELGSDDVALWKQEGAEAKKAAWHQKMLDLGWKPDAVKIVEPIHLKAIQ